MSRLFHPHVATLICATFICQTSFAAAYQLYEVGAPTEGTAGVGQAVVMDASGSYYNPAAMSLLPTTEFMLGSHMLLPYVNFRTNTSNTLRGDNGGNAGILTPGMGSFFVYSYSPCLKFGASLTSPYGGSLMYDDGWVGRYIVQNVLFASVNLNPSVAFKFNEYVAVGAGFSIEYMFLNQSTALPILSSPLVDGQITVKVDNWSPGFNLGLLFTPTPETRIGVAYRSQITHNMHGRLVFYRALFSPNVSTEVIEPQSVILSLAQSFNCHFTLLAELGWGNWAAVEDNTLTVDGLTAVTELNWHNTWRAGVAAQYSPNPIIMFQAGVSYDSSPTGTATRIPNLPMDRQIRAGAGAVVSLAKNVQVAASYEYANMGSAPINHVGRLGVLSGKYVRNYVNFMQISVNASIL